MNKVPVRRVKCLIAHSKLEAGRGRRLLPTGRILFKLTGSRGESTPEAKSRNLLPSNALNVRGASSGVSACDRSSKAPCGSSANGRSITISSSMSSPSPGPSPSSSSWLLQNDSAIDSASETCCHSSSSSKSSIGGQEGSY